MLSSFVSVSIRVRTYLGGTVPGPVVAPGAKGIAPHLQALVTLCLWTLATQGIGRDLMGIYLPSPNDE